jgi:hypothetical protein
LHNEKHPNPTLKTKNGDERYGLFQFYQVAVFGKRKSKKAALAVCAARSGPAVHGTDGESCPISYGLTPKARGHAPTANGKAPASIGSKLLVFARQRRAFIFIVNLLSGGLQETISQGESNKNQNIIEHNYTRSFITRKKARLKGRIFT